MTGVLSGTLAVDGTAGGGGVVEAAGELCVGAELAGAVPGVVCPIKRDPPARTYTQNKSDWR
jgi:hypothetical protein